MPDPLPLVKCRVQEMQPFEVNGVDCTDALFVRDTGKESKVYECLSCTLTKAMHSKHARGVLGAPKASLEKVLRRL